MLTSESLIAILDVCHVNNMWNKILNIKVCLNQICIAYACSLYIEANVYVRKQNEDIFKDNLLQRCYNYKKH